MAPKAFLHPLEVLFLLNGWYCASYFLIETLIFIYKGLILPYPTSHLILELFLLFLYVGTEVSWLFLGCRGNLCERKLPLVVSLGLTVPTGLLALYFLLTYALRLETVLNCILLLFYGLESILYSPHHSLQGTNVLTNPVCFPDAPALSHLFAVQIAPNQSAVMPRYSSTPEPQRGGASHFNLCHWDLK
ncbi:hypothetical protein XELAEV_18016534mg [Xenopus laevis]|uniref:Transmembrane protein 216 n=1 Tax=Xenopus laevis TaxID=8355 RepID=A0A974DLP0_XENLA|nr:hypothetical protein XELAEV_18016534mg [Xenopus laevis]